MPRARGCLVIVGCCLLSSIAAQLQRLARPHVWLARYLVSQRPEVEAALAAELGAAGLLATMATPDPPHIGLDDLARLPYLGAVCKALRPC